jgi:hypothetical protein
MSLTVGGKKKTKFRMLAGMPDTHSMAGMPQKGSPGTMEHGLTDYDYMPTIPGKRYGYKTLKGMPNTRQLNGGWGADHPGRMENRGKDPLLERKRREMLKDPQEKRKQGQIRLDETDNAPGFIKDKLLRNGSVTATGYGMCLKGEEEGAIPEDGLFYGIKNGKRGWYEVKEAVEEDDKVDPGRQPDGAFWYDPSTGYINNGGVYVGRTWVSVEGVSASESGWYAVEVVFGAENDTAVIKHYSDDVPQATDTETYLPLYYRSKDGIMTDYRSNFVVQCWER